MLKMFTWSYDRTLVYLRLIGFWQCAFVVAKTFSNKLVAFLLQKLEQSSKDEKMRIAALSIIRHLVNAAGTFCTLHDDLLLPDSLYCPGVPLLLFTLRSCSVQWCFLAVLSSLLSV